MRQALLVSAAEADRGDVPVDDQSAQELRHLGAAHLGWMALTMEEDEPADPAT